MDEPTLNLDARVRALERQARWGRAALAAALALLALSRWTTGQAAARGPEAELQARRFVLVSGEGRPLAALESTAQGAPRLSLLREGVARLFIALAPDGSPSLSLNDGGGAPRVLLNSSGEESTLSLAGPARTRTLVAADATAPRLALSDAAGNDRLWVALRLGSPAVQFLDAQGRARSGFTTFNDDSGVAVISAADGATPGLVLYGKERTIKWSAP